MKKKIMIDGMMCEHCEAHVKEALENLGASEIEVTHEGGYAVCEIDKDNDEIKAVIEEEGYTVTAVN